MQPLEYARFKNHIEATSRPDVWEKRMRMAPELIELRHDSINSLVAAVQGNSRDKAWLSNALQAGEVVRDEMGRLGLPKPSAAAPTGEEKGSLDWFLEQLWECDAHVSISFMECTIRTAWQRALDMRAEGLHYVVDEETDVGHWEARR
jgi:hypothetical protein